MKGKVPYIMTTRVIKLGDYITYMMAYAASNQGAMKLGMDPKHIDDHLLVVDWPGYLTLLKPNHNQYLSLEHSVEGTIYKPVLAAKIIGEMIVNNELLDGQGKVRGLRAIVTSPNVEKFIQVMGLLRLEPEPLFDPENVSYM